MFNLALIILLSGDISLNPGPGQSSLSFKLVFANNQSIKNKATHNHGHTLDLLPTLNEDIVTSNVKSEGFISDHSVVTANLNLPHTPIHDSSSFAFRNLHKINLDFLNCDLKSSDLLMKLTTTAQELYSQYHNNLTSLLDNCVPRTTKKIKKF